MINIFLKKIKKMHIYMAYVVIFVIVVAVLFIMKKSGKGIPSVF
jgi:hypothetical protein